MRTRLFAVVLAGFLVFSLAGSAMAVAVSASCRTSNVPPNRIFTDAALTVPVPEGKYVQLVRSADATPNIDLSTGLPNGGDTVVATGEIGKPDPLGAGEISLGGSFASSTYVYLVVWDTWTGSGAPTGHYGYSAPASVGTGFTYTYKPVSFAVNRSVARLTINPNTVNQGTTPSLTITIAGGTFTAGTTFDFGTGISVTSKNLDSPTQYTVNISVASDAPTGAHAVSASTGGSGTITVNAVVIVGPALTAASPSSGLQGQTINEVTVTGANTHFTRSAPTVDFGSGITHGSVSVESDTVLRVASVAIASSATVGSRVVSVSVTGPAETATGEVFSVSAPVTQVVIDNYEGLTGDHVADPTPATMGEDGDFYYTFEPAPAEKPTYARQGTTLHAGSYAMSLTYPSSVQGWRGYGGQLRANTDISAMTVLSFWIKTDGSLTVKAQLKDSEGDSYASAEQAITGNASWQEVQIALSAINTEVADSDLDNDGLDLNSIKEYQFVFVGSGAVTAPIYIDDVTAIVTTTPPTPEGDDPHIDTITSPAAPTDSITLTGTNFLTDGGEVVFVNRNADGTEGTVVTTVRSAGSGSPITVWDTARVTLTLPQMVAGQKSVRLTRTDGKTSNTVTLEVTASAAAGPAYNYPNPFKPISGERTNIIFTPGSATYAKILIFDMTAKIIKKLQWTGGTPSVEWDGKNDFGEIVGDGVYLYRVVDDGNKLLGKGKILAVNRR